MKLVTEEGDMSFNMSIEWSPETVEELYVRETVDRPPSPMILLVRRPDYIGNAMWEFRHAKVSIFAKVADEEWLSAFQARRIDVRPGDALRCLVSQVVSYGYDNEVVSERFVIAKVLDVIENRTRQLDFLDDDGKQP